MIDKEYDSEIDNNTEYVRPNVHNSLYFKWQSKYLNYVLQHFLQIHYSKCSQNKY